MQLSHVRISNQDGQNILLVDFVNYKHGNEICTVHVYPDKTCCPVQALLKYLKLRGTKSGPLFIHSNGLPVSRDEVAEILKQTLMLINEDPTQYNTHSFRIGRLCSAAENGATETQLRLLGRWKSNAFLKYLRPLSTKFKNVH